MRYPMPNFPCEFEIPDDWPAEAGMTVFKPLSLAYRSTPCLLAPHAAVELVPLAAVEPPIRSVTVPKDGRGFDHDRLVRILRGFVDGAEIEAIPLFEPQRLSEFTPHPYKYRTRNGYHRFYASIAAGFMCLPGAAC
jgi:hypothetical protein